MKPFPVTRLSTTIKTDFGQVDLHWKLRDIVKHVEEFQEVPGAIGRA